MTVLVTLVTKHFMLKENTRKIFVIVKFERLLRLVTNRFETLPDHLT